MDKQYICYCGLYCENCAVRAKINPAAKTLYDEMRSAGFEEVVSFIPGGDGFWLFLKDMAEKGMCTSCIDGGGNPDCAVRKCAKEKGVGLCALCKSYPCEYFGEAFAGYPIINEDNALICEKGIEAWAKLQDERRANDFIYTAEK